MFHLNVESMFVWLISTLWSFHTFEFILQPQIFHINYNFSWSWLRNDANFVNKIILSTGKSLILSFIYFFLLKNKSLISRMVSDWWEWRYIIKSMNESSVSFLSIFLTVRLIKWDLIKRRMPCLNSNVLFMIYWSRLVN